MRNKRGNGLHWESDGTILVPFELNVFVCYCCPLFWLDVACVSVHISDVQEGCE
jgi:hypothetical protein